MNGTNFELGVELEALASERLADPVRGLDRVRSLQNGGTDDVAVHGYLLFLNGLFLKQLLRKEEAQLELERSVRWAKNHNLADIESRARANLAVLLTDLGKPAESAAHMRAAIDGAPDSAKGLVTYLEALLLQRQGSHHQALATYSESLIWLERAGDEATIAALRLNRSIGLTYLGDIDGARQELLHAETSATEMGLVCLAAMAAQNLGFADGRRGYLADALAAFDRAERRYQELSWRPKQAVVMHSDKAEILLQAGLATDAREAITRAVNELEADGIVSELTEARLLLARICAALGDYAEAKRVASVAAREFRCARRPAWVKQALYVARQVDYLATQDLSGGDLRLSARLEHLANRLIDQGWPVEGRDALVLGALTALEARSTERAALLLGRAGRVRAAGAVQHRARLHLARAQLLRQVGERGKAAAVVRRGVRHALATLTISGSPEARMEGFRFADELTGFGTTLALEAGQPVAVLRAIELQRSVAQAFAPSGTVADELGGSLNELRSGGDTPTLETSVRERSFRSRADPTSSLSQVGWQQFRRTASEKSFVYYLDAERLVWAVVVRGSSTRLVKLAAETDVRDAVTFLDFAVTRLSSLGSKSPRARIALEREVSRVRKLLVEPLELKAGPLVVVPSPSLHGLLWGLLGTDSQEISLATSAASWVSASAKPDEPITRPVLVSGPRLEAGEQEIEKLRAFYPESTLLTGSNATVDNVLDSFAEADLVHIAAHGRFRAESPMFSRLELSDGHLTIYDLQRLPALPKMVVLPACETAASKLYESGGSLGTASALVSLGTRTVVAPLQPVADEVTCAHMISFHEHLSKGASPAKAMHQAVHDAVESNDTERLVAAAMFVVSGVG